MTACYEDQHAALLNTSGHTFRTIMAINQTICLGQMSE